MEKKLLQPLLFLLTLTALSQETKTLVSGTIIDSLGIVKNANIINLKTKQGTFSSEQGLFRIFVSEGDTLSFSSVQHIPKKIVITEKILEQKELQVSLKSSTYTLDEFELKRHNLIGILGADVKAVPKSKRDSLLRNVMDFSEIDFSEIDSRIDENIRAKPIIVNTVPNSYSGLNAFYILDKINPFKKQKRSRLKNKDDNMSQKKAFPMKLLSELGDNFFFENLKIPKEKYFHFLDYCKNSDIEKLYKENKILDIIEILRKESVSYLKTLKEQ